MPSAETDLLHFGKCCYYDTNYLSYKTIADIQTLNGGVEEIINIDNSKTVVSNSISSILPVTIRFCFDITNISSGSLILICWQNSTHAITISLTSHMA